MTLRSDFRFLGITALGLAAFPFLFHLIGGYPGLATQIVIVSIASIGFNLLLGYAGMLSYGQAMFYGGGGYAAVILLIRVFPHHPSLWACVIIAAIVMGIIAVLIGALTVRLYGIYFALLTLAFAQMIFFVVEQAKDWTGGDDGLQSFPNAVLDFPFGPWSVDLHATLPAANLGIFGDLSDIHLWYVFAALVLLAVIFFVRLLNRSQFGEVLEAIRMNEERSSFVGFNAAGYRLAAFAIAGVLTGLSGALRALYDGTISVDSLGIDRSGSFVVYTVVGGVQTLFGPIVGTGLIMWLENVLSAKTAAWQLIEGLIFVGMIVFLPSGIVGTILNRRRAARKILTDSITLPPTVPGVSA